MTSQVADDVFGIQPNVPVLHQVVTAQLAARRCGHAEHQDPRRGVGWRQEAVQAEGHGQRPSGLDPRTALQRWWRRPRPEAAQVRPAHPQEDDQPRTALGPADRAAEGKVVVVDEWGFDAPKTKAAKAALASLGIEGKALVVVDRDDINTIKSFLNLPEVQLIERAELNAYDMLCNEYIVFSKATLPRSRRPSRASRGAAGGRRRRDRAPPPQRRLPPTSKPTRGRSAKAADGGAPEGYEIKGNEDSGLYHAPGSRFYKQTVAEVWFDTEESAEAAGFQLPPHSRAPRLPS